MNLHYTRVSCFALMCTWKVLVKEEAYGCRQVRVPAGRDDSTWLVGALYLRDISSTNSSLLGLSDWHNWPSVVDMVSSLQTIYVPLLYESIRDESRG